MPIVLNGTTGVTSSQLLFPNMQYYRLENDFVGQAATTAQSLFGAGVTLAANTVYAFEFSFLMQKTLSTASHTKSIGFGGTATVNNIFYQAAGIADGQAALAINSTAAESFRSNTTAQTVLVDARTTGLTTSSFFGSGTVSINAGGTFIPQYQLSTGVGPFTTFSGSYFMIYPIGAAGANTIVGTWS